MSDYSLISVLGARYDFTHVDELELGTSSAAMYAFEDQTIWLHATTFEAAFATVTGIFGVDFVEELHLGNGRLLLGHYEARDEELAIVLARNTVAFWTDEQAALWTDVGSRGSEWATDLLAALQPTSSDGSAFATAADPRRGLIDRDEILVTIFPEVPSNPPYKVFGLSAIDTQPSPSGSGHRTSAGELFMRSSGDGQSREVLLRSSSALAIASDQLFEAEDLRIFVEGFSRLERNGFR